MSRALYGLSIFRLPSFFTKVSTVPSPLMEQFIPTNPVIYNPGAMFVQETFVGCMIITNSIGGYGYDIVLPMLRGNSSYGLFTGKIEGPHTSIACVQTLMRIFNIQVSSDTPFIDVKDPGTGNTYRIYIKYMRSLDLVRLNHTLSQSIARVDFAYFTRFPLNLMQSHSHQSLLDDSGVSKTLNAAAAYVVNKVHHKIHHYVN